jgi:hypothetical protein
MLIDTGALQFGGDDMVVTGRGGDAAVTVGSSLCVMRLMEISHIGVKQHRYQLIEIVLHFI